MRTQTHMFTKKIWNGELWINYNTRPDMKSGRMKSLTHSTKHPDIKEVQNHEKGFHYVKSRFG